MRERICVAVDRDAKSSASISVASYRCEATGRNVVVNNSVWPYSPYSGGDLKRISQKVIKLPIGEIRTDKDMCCVGNCPTCEGQLYMFAKEAKTLVGKRIHCIICDTRFKVRAEDDGTSTIDSDNDKNKDKKKIIDKKENEDEDTEIVQASDDNDNDNDNEGEDAADVGEDISGDNNDNNDNDDDNSSENAVEETPPVSVPGAEVTAPGAAVPNTTPPAAEENPNPTPAPGSETTDVSGEGEENPDDTSEGEGDNNDNDDASEDEDDSEIVSANTKQLVINCFTRAGNLSDKTLQFIPVSSRLGLIMADDAPIITLDAEKAGDNKKLFDDPETLTKAVKAIIDQEENITPKSFASLGGRAIKFTVPVADAIKQRIEAGIGSVTKSLDKRKQKLIKEMQACLSIASLIINKGVDRELPNPLRDNLVASLHRFNITSADTLVDQAFIEAAEPYIAAVLAKANDLYSQPLSTRNEIARFVERTPYATIANTGGNEHSKKFSKGNVLVNTAGFKEEEPDPPVREVTASAVNSRVEGYRRLFRQ